MFTIVVQLNGTEGDFFEAKHLNTTVVNEESQKYLRIVASLSQSASFPFPMHAAVGCWFMALA
uniref:Uncharacterized protein n=1 Tax=Arundo donax TaxID=35708 RepID=A0A0A8Y739_ARUDO